MRLTRDCLSHRWWIDAIVDGSSGLLEVGRRAFAAAMMRMVLDKQLRLLLGKRGMTVRYFNSEGITDAWLGLYRRHLKQ